MPDKGEPKAPTDTEPSGKPAAGPEISEEDLAKQEELNARFEALYKRHYGRTVAYISRMRFSREEARDLAQETFIRVFQGMATFRGETESEERAYIQTTALHVVLNTRRGHGTKKRSAKEISMEDLPSPESAPSRNLFTGLPPSSGEEYTERRETIQRLYDAIQELPENLRVPLLLRIPDKAYKEIAAILGLSVGAVKAKLREARKRLREKLGEEPTGFPWPEDPAEDGRDREN